MKRNSKPTLNEAVNKACNDITGKAIDWADYPGGQQVGDRLLKDIRMEVFYRWAGWVDENGKVIQ